ncbi:MAG: (Fe-S)-binding protein [Gammaproteobacteria bacterium]|nr:(Fe-S)-binding protein [Gammaproteobacteria bacterium]
MSKTITQLSEDFVTRFARDLYHCSSCNYCVDAVWPERGMHAVCATLEQHSRAPGYSGRGYIEAARAIMEGQALDAATLADRVFSCTTCGNCEAACPLGLRPATIGRALREELLAVDALPPALANARDTFIAHGNPYGLPRDQRRAWLPDDEPVAQDAAMSLFTGCASALPTGAEARAGHALLKAAGVTVAVVSDACCGAPLAELGLRREGEALARAAAARLGAAEVLVAGCECAAQLRGANLKPRSIVRWLCDAVTAGQVDLHWKDDVARPSSVRLVESCQHKRDGRDGDEAAVAALLASLGCVLLNEDFPNRHATCCGAAGGMPAMAPAAAARMARACLPPTGLAVSLDARCANHLQACAGEDVEVLGIASFIEHYFRVAARPVP